MSRLGITFEEVAEAAAYIQTEGQIPTIDKIRQYLGGTGSNTTISKYLGQWRSHQFSTGTAHLRENSPHIPDVVKSAVDKVWQEIKDQADVEIATAKALADEQVGVANNSATLASQALNEMNIKHQDLLDSFNSLRAEKELLLLDVKTLQSDYQDLQIKHKNLQERQAEVERLTAHHLHDLKQTHDNECLRLVEQCEEKVNLVKEMSDNIKGHAEDERQKYLVALDASKTTEQSLKKSNEALKGQMQEQASILNNAQSALLLAEERAEFMQQQMLENQVYIQQLLSNMLIPKDTLETLIQQPKLDILVNQLTIPVIDVINKQWLEFKDGLEVSLANRLAVELSE